MPTTKETWMHLAERIACQFHATYERLAPDHGYETRRDSARPWTEVPDQNRDLMVAVAQHLLDTGVIRPGPGAAPLVEHEPGEQSF